jgi:prepilin-type N-terminal cleavage/methylation domain-containing protein
MTSDQQKATAMNAHKQNERRRGFSTMELMLVITIMGMMAGIAITKIDLAKMEANSAVQILSTTMVAAQREAITKQHDIIMTFDAGDRTVRMIWDRNSNGAINNGERIRVIPLDGRIGFGLGGATAGSASGIGGFYLTSNRAIAEPTKYQSDTRAVEIIRATGRTEWYRYTGTAWKRGF